MKLVEVTTIDGKRALINPSLVALIEEDFGGGTGVFIGSRWIAVKDSYSSLHKAVDEG